MKAEFAVNSEGRPMVTTGLEVVDLVLTSERRNLPEVLAAIEDIRGGRKSKWEYGYDGGGFILNRDTALVYAGWHRGPVDELPLNDLEEVIRSFLAFRYVPPRPRKRHG
jgi:hypothetical protein